METETKYRYPGANYFKETDSDIFCGRDEDAQKLLGRTLLNNTIVLHGESGTGKSSLVRAGLMPLLKKQNEIRLRQGKPQYLPVTIGLDEIRKHKADKTTGTDDNILVRYTLDLIDGHAALKAATIPFIEPKQNNLWYTAKLFEKNNYTLLLLFDQFEELQGYSTTQIKIFTEALAALFTSSIPEALCDEYNRNTSHIRLAELTDAERQAYSNDIGFIEQPLSVRLLFAVREDRLGTMSLMSDYFPDILKNDFLLQPLTEPNAHKAIGEPCLKEGHFFSQPFTIEPEAITAIIDSLKVKQRQPGFYDPIELQIVCNRIEKKVMETGMASMGKDDLPPVENAISEFYAEKWALIKNKYNLGDTALLTIKKHFIKELVEKRKRNLVLEESLINNEMDQKVTADLVAEGLIRMIPSGEDRYYQLCHDRFIEPMLIDTIQIKSGEDADKAAKKRRRNGMIFLSAMAVLAAGIFMFLLRNKARNAKQTTRLNLVTTIKRSGNPTLSYIIGKDWLKDNPWSDSMTNLLAGFDTSRQAYLAGAYPTFGNVEAVTITPNGQVTITDDKGVTVLDAQTGRIKERNAANHDMPGKKIKLPSGGYLQLFNTGDSIVVRDGMGNKKGGADASGFPDITDTDITPDGKCLYAENKCYSLPSSKPLDILPPYFIKEDREKPYMVEQTAFAFIDNNHYATGYKNGVILIRAFDVANPNKIKVADVDTLNGDDWATHGNGEHITKLAIDGRGRYLFAFNAQYGIDVYDRAKLKMAKDTIADNSKIPITNLKGHTGSITCIDFSPDGQRMVTGSNDGTAILWDIDKLENITTLNVKKGAAVTYAAFADNGQDIVTATDEDIVYLWKTDKPSVLHEKGQLYRYADFNYKAWYLQQGGYEKPRPDSTVAQRYTALLHSLLNLPALIEYPNDIIYTNALDTAFADIKARYTQLRGSKGISREAADLLRLHYVRALKKEQDMFKTSGLDLKKLEALEKIDLWQEFFADTSNRFVYSLLLYEFMQGYESFEKNNFYTAQAAYIHFYEDSILQPLLKQYGQNSHLIRMKRQVDIGWLRVYICNKQDTAAINRAKVIAVQYPISLVIDYRLYQVATYLLFDKYEEAASLYKSLGEKSRISSTTKRTLSSFLKDLSAKSTNPATVQRFTTAFDILAHLGVDD
jgi:WD40 repeat protein